MKSFSALSTAGRGVARQDGRRLCAPGAASRPRDRHTRASLGVVDLEARPCPPDPPAPSTPVGSRRPPIGRYLVPPGGPPRRCLSLGAPRAPGA